ncbi:bacitracin ABC transporter permease [Virgibacillus pantothenticus]|uniref:ABC transporter permease n=1 Tax=Virgibacillus pantothenticus TaxID=1473 RepID=UPI001B2F106E|nr:ABC transporter permease [Virgibacillus pantothenticus]GIP62667.1 bacitracin ABC transporter permease [Virgibacillus pantothenticus]
MNKFATSSSVEYEKFFHSKIPLITLVVCMLVPFIGGFFMFVLKNPDFAERLGFISKKAQLIGTADWPSYLSLLAQAISIGGLIVFGFIMSWIFGREYSDRTIKDLLALPISRHMVVLAKFVVAVCWCLILSIFVLALGLLVGIMVNIPGWSQEIIVQGITIYGVCATLTILVSTPVAFVASIGQGYLSPLGFMIFTLVLAQIVTVAGYGRFFPWAIPALASGAAGNGSFIVLSGISLTILLLTSAIGLISTMLWWRYADQH